MSQESKKYWTDDPELVERYVLGQFSPEEKNRLDAEISDCEPCKALIAQEREIAAGIRRHGRDRMKADLRKRFRRDRSTQFFSYQYIGMAAAVIVIAIGIGLYQVWFSDLVAPKKFHNQQVIITSKTDTSTKKPEHEPKNDIQKDDQLLADGSSRKKKRERRETISADEPSTSEIIAQHSDDANADGRTDVPAVQPSISDIGEQASGVSAAEPRPSTLWLIGNVVVISEHSDGSLQKSASERSVKEKSSRPAPSLNMAAAKKTNGGRIVFRHRAEKDLPPERKGQPTARGKIETMLERSGDRLVVTLYDDSMDDEVLQSAVVETFTDDLLVVALPNQRITYRLPSGWNESTRSR